MFKRNIGSIDRALRIVLGIVLIALAYPFLNILGYWGWIGVVPLLTGLMSSCPLYSIFGISTCKTAK